MIRKAHGQYFSEEVACLIILSNPCFPALSNQAFCAQILITNIDFVISDDILSTNGHPILVVFSCVICANLSDN